jgi:hypothetical protein
MPRMAQSKDQHDHDAAAAAPPAAAAPSTADADVAAAADVADDEWNNLRIIPTQRSRAALRLDVRFIF